MEKNGKNQGSSKKEGEIAVGTVIEALPNTLFRISLGEDKEILAYLSGKMRLHRIRVLIGDRVEMVLDPYGGRGRITRRL